MTRQTPVLRMMLMLAACGLVSIALDTHDAHIEAPRPPIPLHVAGTWWSPTALRVGIRSLHGRVVNTTDSVWSNVQVSIRFMDAHGESLYVKTVPMGSIEPRASAEFATGSLPDEPQRYELYGLTGTALIEHRRLVVRPVDGVDPKAGARGGIQ